MTEPPSFEVHKSPYVLCAVRSAITVQTFAHSLEPVLSPNMQLGHSHQISQYAFRFVFHSKWRRKSLFQSKGTDPTDLHILCVAALLGQCIGD